MGGSLTPNPASGGGAIYYRVKSGGDHCRVHITTGAVTGLAGGTCQIEALWRGDGIKYLPSSPADVGNPITVTAP